MSIDSSDIILYMNKLEILGTTFDQLVAASKMRTILHMFNVIQNPEPYIASITPDDIEQNYFFLPEFDLFRPELGISDRTRNLTLYLGDMATQFAPDRGEPLRKALVTFGDAVTDKRYDRPYFVDTKGRQLTANQILPEPVILESAVNAMLLDKSPTLLNIYVEQSIARLGDRVPQLPGLTDPA
ncbi:MAG: hypothetical protein JWO41_418 [Candidatus Saccharibacteria bacterium]|nr:hypothetical protein [Candidatus Saccharibacteria bacterium]